MFYDHHYKRKLAQLHRRSGASTRVHNEVEGTLMGRSLVMRPIDLHYVIWFKRGIYLRSESPLEEVWTWIARIGITDWLKRSVKTDGRWEDWAPYAVARVRQAVEFRTAARNISILTRPLPLYYSLLNLLRGFIGMNKAREAQKKDTVSPSWEKMNRNSSIWRPNSLAEHLLITSMF